MRIATLALMLLSSTLFMQCDESDLMQQTGDDYYPLAERTQWKYLEEYFAPGDDSDLQSSDTATYVVKGDTLIDGITYRVVWNRYGTVEKVVRKEGSQYFGRHHEFYGTFAKEYLFLDEAAPVNTTWQHVKDETLTMTEYIVTSVGSSYTVGNVEYHDVIEMTVNYYYKDGDDYTLNYTAQHYYAKGFGEVFAFYPYPSIDLNVTLLNFKQP